MNTEQNSTVRICLDKDKRLSVQVTKAILPEAIQLCLAAIEAMCKETLKRADDPNLVKSLEEDMYDMINMGASSLLDKLFPHITMRPDVTVDALLQAENDLINKNAKAYGDAYEFSAQSQKDMYEHALAKANLAIKDMNREQKRKLKKK